MFYGWLIVLIALLNLTVGYAIRYTFPVFYVAILDDFNWGRAATVGPFSVSLIVYAVGAPITGGLVDRYGVRVVVPLGGLLVGAVLAGFSQVDALWQLYLLFAIGALGTLGIGYVPHMAIVPNWFSRRRGLATGIVTAGITLSMALAPASQRLVASLGWRHAYLVLAAVAASLPPLLSFLYLRDRPEKMGLGPDGTATTAVRGPKPRTARQLVVVDGKWAATDWTMGRVLRTRRSWSLVFFAFLFGLWSYSPLMHQVAYLVDKGYTLDLAALVAGAFGAFATAGCFLGFISDRLGREGAYSLAAAGALAGLLLLYTSQGTGSAWLPWAYSLTFGLSFGLAAPLLAAIAADMFQGNHLGAINGLVMGAFVTGGALGPWISGHTYDTTGNYGIAFVIWSACILLSTAVLLRLVAPGKVRKTMRITIT